MTLRRHVPTFVALAVLVVAGVGYSIFIPIRHHHLAARLARLVVTAPPPGFTAKPVSSQSVSATDVPFTTYQSIAKKAPGSTGAYSVAWDSKANTADSATLLVSVLPSALDARDVEAQAANQTIVQQSLKSDDYTYVQSVPVSGIADASGGLYKSTQATNKTPLEVVEFASGRAQVLEFVGLTGTTAGLESDARALALSEQTHLGTVLPGFSFSDTSYPLVASVIYAGSAVVLAGIVVAVPAAAAARRRRLQRALERARLREYRGRGGKVARRQSARR